MSVLNVIWNSIFPSPNLRTRLDRDIKEVEGQLLASQLDFLTLDAVKEDLEARDAKYRKRHARLQKALQALDSKGNTEARHNLVSLQPPLKVQRTP